MKCEITLEDTFPTPNLGQACHAEEVQDLMCILR